MKLVDSTKQQLNMMELLYQYFKNENPKKTDADFQQWIVQMTALLADEKMTVEQIGNSLIVSRRKTEDAPAAVVWMMNVDTMQNAAKNLAEGFMNLSRAGVTDMVGVYAQRVVSRIIRSAFKSIQNDGDKLQITKAKSGKTVAYIHLDTEGDYV